VINEELFFDSNGEICVRVGTYAVDRSYVGAAFKNPHLFQKHGRNLASGWKPGGRSARLDPLRKCGKMIGAGETSHQGI